LTYISGNKLVITYYQSPTVRRCSYNHGGLNVSRIGPNDF